MVEEFVRAMLHVELQDVVNAERESHDSDDDEDDGNYSNNGNGLSRHKSPSINGLSLNHNILSSSSPTIPMNSSKQQQQQQRRAPGQKINTQSSKKSGSSLPTTKLFRR